MTVRVLVFQTKKRLDKKINFSQSYSSFKMRCFTKMRARNVPRTNSCLQSRCSKKSQIVLQDPFTYWFQLVSVPKLEQPHQQNNHKKFSECEVNHQQHRVKEIHWKWLRWKTGEKFPVACGKQFLSTCIEDIFVALIVFYCHFYPLNKKEWNPLLSSYYGALLTGCQNTCAKWVIEICQILLPVITKYCTTFFLRNIFG